MPNFTVTVTVSIVAQTQGEALTAVEQRLVADKKINPAYILEAKVSTEKTR